MRTADLKRTLDKVGLGWMVWSEDQLPQLSLCDLKPLTLVGNFDLGFALGRYSIPRAVDRKRTSLGELLHRFKYEQDRQAGHLLAGLLCEFIQSHKSLSSCDLLIAVPPSYSSRPFDPVSILAEEIERQTRILWERDVLKRGRLTKPQKETRERQVKELNVLNVHRLAKPLDLSGTSVLLLDDTFDSGATMDEISLVLREARAEKICALAVAKAGAS